MNHKNRFFLCFSIIGIVLTGCTSSLVPITSTTTHDPTAILVPTRAVGLPSISSESILQHLSGVEGIRHPGADPENFKKAQAYIEEKFREFGYEVMLQSFALGDDTFQNVIATRVGTRLPEERILIMAHFDTISTSPGADDNGSGVAMILALAEAFQTTKFERTVQFVATNLEEFSLVGSQELVRYSQEMNWRIKAVINVDCVGYAGPDYPQISPGGLEDTFPKKGDFIGIVGNEYSRSLVEAFVSGIRRWDLALPFYTLILPGDGLDFPDSRRNDIRPFWYAGYPGIFLTDTGDYRNPNYHTPQDVNETLNLDFMSDVIRAIGEFVIVLAIPVN